MTASRDHLQIRLNRLLVQLPRMLRDYPDPAEFWPVFAAEADVIIDGAGPENIDGWLDPDPNNLSSSYAILDDPLDAYYQHELVKKPGEEDGS